MGASISSDPSAFIKLTSFPPQPGIYFENLGQTSLITSEWEIIIYLNMKSYWQESQLISKTVEVLKSLCQAVPEYHDCHVLLHQFEHQLQEIRSSNQLLLQQHKPKYYNKAKRSPFDFVGSVANTLFGVLDQKYADKVSKIIEDLERNDNHLLQMIRNQTTIIEATVNIMRKQEEDIATQFSIIERNFGNLTKEIKTLDLELEQQKIIQRLTSLSLYINLLMNGYQRIQGDILEVVTDTHHGKISTLLLTPSQLYDQLKLIKSHLPSTLLIPGDHEGHNLLKLYKIMSVGSRVTMDRILFSVRLPLVANERFELYQLTSIPTLLNNTFISIKPSSDYLILNLHRDKIYPISSTELKTCLSTSKNEHLCKQSQPIYKRNSNFSHCEISLLNKHPSPATCEVQIVNQTQVWIQLANPNFWIFSLKEATITIVCGINIIQQTLKGAGLLKLMDTCTIKLDTIIINSYNKFYTELQTTYQVSDNVTENFLLQLPPNTTRYTYTYKGRYIDEINKLQKDLKELEKKEQFPLQPHDIHQFSISYITVFFVVILTAYLVWTIIKRRSTTPDNTSNHPIPQPRRRNNAEFRFEIGDFNRREDVNNQSNSRV